MGHDYNIVSATKSLQRAIRAQFDKRGLHLKLISMDSGIPYPTLLSYFPAGEHEPANLPLSALHALAGNIPDDLLSLLAPDGFVMVRAEFSDELEEEAHCLERLRAIHERRRNAA